QLAGEWAIQTPRGDDATSRRLRREMWQAWWRSLDGPELLAEFRSRVLPDAERAAVLKLIAELGSANQAEQTNANHDLLALGPKVAPLLRRALQQAGAKSGDRLAKCLQLVEKD